MRIKEKLQHIIKNSLTNLNIAQNLNEIIIENSPLQNSYTYCTNIALSLTRKLHKKPEEIAETLKNTIKDEMIEKIEVTYPATLNIYISKEYLLKAISTIIEKNINYGRSNIGSSRKISIDFSNSNFTNNISIEKIFSVIHGDNLSRILEYNNFKVTKEYYLNDTSKELENLAIKVKERYKEICNLNSYQNKENYNDEFVSEIANNIYNFYNIKKQNEKIEFFKNKVVETLLATRKKELDTYRINFNNYTSESYLYDKGLVDEILNKLNKKGYTYLYEDELWLNMKDYNNLEDINLIKSDGTYNIILPTLAYQIDRLKKDYDGLINIYFKENNSYLKNIKPILQMLEYDHKKLENKLLPKINTYKEDNEIENINNIINELDINSIRYLFSMQNTESSIIDLKLSSEYTNENYIYYIEKTNIMIHQLLANYHKKITKVNKFSTINNPLAYIILNKLYEFEDIVIISGIKLMPHLICNYLYELVNLFNEYYQSEEIITEDEKYTNERLNFLLAIKIVINNALDLIGIIPREEL